MLRTVWKQHPWAAAILALASLAALIFAVRLAIFTVHWMDPAHREVAVEGWMTPGYVAMSWQIPKPVVMEMLGLDERPEERVQIKDLAAQRGIPVAELIAELEAALAAEKAAGK